MPEPTDPVDDTEFLYREIPNDPSIARYENGELRISSTAFNDRGRQPSVDRATLCGNNPNYAMRLYGSEAGVLELLTKEIRQNNTSHGTTGVIYKIDVSPDPLPDNPAHACIHGNPPFDSDGVFDRIKKALARIAKPAIFPTHLKSTEEEAA